MKGGVVPSTQKQRWPLKRAVRILLEYILVKSISFQEETSRTRGEMEAKLFEAVRQAKEEGKKKLEAAVQETEERLNAYHAQKEREAREEERTLAAQEAERVAR